MKKRALLFLTAASIFSYSCEKIDEKFSDSLANNAAGTVTAADILNNIYNNDMRALQNQDGLWALEEHTTDECVGPTRAGDWDDNGIWRVLHAHTWDANHNFVRGAFNNLGRIVYNATEALSKSPSPAEEAEAKFLRAFANFYWLEGWNQIPYREPGGDPLAIPSVRTGVDGMNYIIAELEEALNLLPVGGLALSTRANQNACRALLIKCYLTKGVIANRENPSFDAGDMTKAIEYANDIVSSGFYSLEENIFDNFAYNNGSISQENIFTTENKGGSSSGNVRSRWHCTMHYNQNPGGWNGFTTLSEFYDKFDATDLRRESQYSGVTNVSGLKVGLLIGQQVDKDGNPLNDRKGNPLSFTKEVKLKETDPNTLEATGIRVVKYPPDYVSPGDNKDNDYVFFRLADVYLMKAEAILRGGTDSNGESATELVNMVRNRAGVTSLSSVNLDQLFDERGREFYWEGWRRMDMIRYGKFLQPGELRTNASGAERLLFPIPAPELAANPNLLQNPGY